MTLTKPFDRHSFDPVNDRDDKKYLKVLRAPGNSRRNKLIWDFSEMSGFDEAQKRKSLLRATSSNFLSHFTWGPRNDGSGLYSPIKGKYLDLGCGDSADSSVAALEFGMESTSIDLFPPSMTHGSYPERAEFTFIQSDIVECIPVEPNSINYASCCAVIDLLSPEDRPKFYQNVFSSLAPGGIFFMSIIRLLRGWGIDGKTEQGSLISAGFEPVWRSSYANIKVRKPA